MRRGVLLSDRLHSIVSPDMRLVLPSQNPGYNKLWCSPVLSQIPVCAEVVQCATVHQGKHAVSIYDVTNDIDLLIIYFFGVYMSFKLSPLISFAMYL